MIELKMPRLLTLLAITALVAAPALIGCKDSGGEAGKQDEANTQQDGHDDHDDHGHPSEGPHGGYLIELGNEEYHAELVNSEEHHTLTIYILDGSAAEEVAIAAATVAINATIDGKPASFELTAADAADGKASKFVSKDEELVHAFDENEASKANLAVTIADTPYSGSIDYHGNHDHDEHGDHDDHDEHGDHEDDEHDDHEDDDHDHDDHDHEKGHDDDHDHEDDDHEHEEAK